MQSSRRTTQSDNQTEPLPAGLKPIRDEDFGFDQARHLLLRAGFGGTPAQIQGLASMGARGAVDYLLEVESVPFREVRANEFDRNIMRPPTPEERAAYQQARRSRDENALAAFRERRQQAQGRDRGQIRRIQRWWLERMIETPRPLEEKMTLFWHDHFATSYRTIENSYHMFQQNQLLRAHALGNFGELLHKIVRDPAMIAYLDNNDSRKGQPNENLSRELLELFSLGVGNYSERDIKEGARALTGYTFEDDEFVFRERDHDNGFKQILGARGSLDGEGFANAILASPACGTFIAYKLYDQFCLHVLNGAHDGDRAVVRTVEALGRDLRGNGYEIRPTLRKLFLSEHFYHPSVVGQRIKSPSELVIGAVRGLNTPVREMQVLIDALELMGQEVMFPPSVKGWDGGRTWINTATLFTRQNTMNYLLTGQLPEGRRAGNAGGDGQFDPMPLLEPLAKSNRSAVFDPEQVSSYLLSLTLGKAETHRIDELAGFCIANGGEVNAAMVTGMLVLVSAMPEYQLT
ncbi:MAG: DUF1800 domain-containing protein [Planctomycetota bacterium]